MLIRSIHKYQDCVEWTKQNVVVYPKFKTPYYFIKVKTGEDSVRATYKNAVRAGVDNCKGEISVSITWHDPECYLFAVNGDCSFKDPATEKNIKVFQENPLEKDEEGTWFIVDAYAVDLLDNAIF